MENKQEWRFCAVGNIVKAHTNNEGETLYGTKKYVGGTKVYIFDEAYNIENRTVTVLGLTRFRRYDQDRIPVCFIENIRLKRIYSPRVLSIMSYLEHCDGYNWHHSTAQDRKTIELFIKKVSEKELLK